MIIDDFKTEIVFRVWKAENNQVIALFPYIDEGHGHCSSYMRIGQHSSAHYAGMIAVTRPATPEEYADLFMELTSIGYDLRVLKRKGNPRKVQK